MQRGKIEEAQGKFVSLRMTKTKARNRRSKMANTESSPWMSDCSGVTRRRPCYRARGWARRDPETRTARRWRCGCRACRHRAPSHRASASGYRNRRNGPWALLFTSRSRCVTDVRPSRRRTSIGRPRPWIGGSVTPPFRERKLSGVSFPIPRKRRKHASGTRCWTGETDIRPSPARSSDEAWRSASVLSKTA